MKPRSKPQTRGARDGDTERRILDAARQVFMRRGTAGARMQEIAEEAGVNQALLHYYFRSKDGLSEAVFLDAANKLVPAVVQALSGEGTLARKIERFVHLYIDTVRKSPYLPGYILSEMHHNPDRIPTLLAKVAGSDAASQAGRLRRRLDEFLRAAAKAGEIRPIRAEQLVVNVVALCVFPFVARPILGAALEMTDRTFDQFLTERRAELPGFILNALRP